MTDIIDPADPHPGMMGDGTEEQNLGQIGHPEARIGEDEVQAAFAPTAPQALADSDRLSALTDKLLAARDQVQESVEAAKAWTVEQARIARVTAARKPVLTVSISAGAALVVGLAVGFLVGRAIED
jgi:ElaB/YqjD/DUF883 family membrane-anchored ribosome-binding protein